MWLRYVVGRLIRSEPCWTTVIVPARFSRSGCRAAACLRREWRARIRRRGGARRSPDASQAESDGCRRSRGPASRSSGPAPERQPADPHQLSPRGPPRSQCRRRTHAHGGATPPSQGGSRRPTPHRPRTPAAGASLDREFRGAVNRPDRPRWPARWRQALPGPVGARHEPRPGWAAHLASRGCGESPCPPRSGREAEDRRAVAGSATNARGRRSSQGPRSSSCGRRTLAARLRRHPPFPQGGRAAR